MLEFCLLNSSAKVDPFKENLSVEFDNKNL